MTKHNLDPTLSKLSKTAIILLSTTLLLGLGAAETLTVDPDGSSDDYGTIQGAIDKATSGSTVVVTDGNYDGFLVDKSLTVRSEEGATPVVNSNPNRPGDRYIEIDPATAEGEISLRGFTVGSDSSHESLLGIRVRKGSSNVEIKSNTLRNLGTGIQTSSSFSGTSEIDNNDFSQRVDVGISVQGSKVESINQNEYRVSSGNVGIAVAHDVEVTTISNNEFSVDAASSEGWPPAAIQLQKDSSASEISSNSVDEPHTTGVIMTSPKSISEKTQEVEQANYVLDQNSEISEVKYGAVDSDKVYDRDIENSDTYYSSIQQAVSEADSGDTIEISKGTYEGDVEIDVEDLTLTSASEDVRPVLQFDSDTGDATVDVFADGVTVEGLNIERSGNPDNFAQGIRISGSDATIADTVVEGKSLSGSENAGIHVIDGDSEESEGKQVTGVVVEDSEVRGFASGISVANWYGGNIQDIQFTDNLVESNYIGFSAGSKSEEVTQESVEVTENTFRDNLFGVYVLGGKTDSEFKQYDISGISVNENRFLNTPRKTVDPSDYTAPRAGLTPLIPAGPEMGRAVVNENPQSLDVERNYWGESNGPEEARIEGEVDWRPYYPTEQAYSNGNSFDDYQSFLSSFDTTTTSQRSNSEIRSIAQDVAGSVPTMSEEEVQSIVESEVDGFVTQDDLDSELNDREETIEEQEETIEEQQERIEELESEVDQLSDQMNQTLEVLEENDQAEVERGPTGQFTVQNPEEDSGQPGNQGGGFLSGLFG